MHKKTRPQNKSAKKNEKKKQTKMQGKKWYTLSNPLKESMSF